MLDMMSQWWVTLFGLSALFMMQLHDTRWRRWGVIMGLIGQPAWYIQLTIHDQFGMLPVFFGYSSVWLYGFWNLWIRRRQWKSRSGS